MLTFNPPELEQQLKEALTNLLKKLNIDPSDISEDLVDPTSEDYDPVSFDDLIITPESTCLVSLPRVNAHFEMTYSQLMNYLLDAQTSTLTDNVEVWGNNSYLLRVNTEHAEALSLLDRHFSYAEKNKIREVIKHTETIDGKDIHCALTRGFTVFGILITANSDWDKYFPPIVDDEYFVEIKFQIGTPKSIIQNVSEAYIFELSTSYNIHLTKFPRPSIDYDEFWNDSDETNENEPDPIQLRPLLVGKGMNEVIKFFNRSKSAEGADIRLLYYAKVIEYVSPTVLRQKLTTMIQNKLSSPRAMNPDAQFILELDRLYQENRQYKKDKEAVALTIEQCCDADELKLLAPPFMKKLAAISDNSTKQDREIALKEFSYGLSATRNSIAHAKANYEPTGEECPEIQLADFVECVALAAQQVVRWFGRCPDHLRVL